VWSERLRWASVASLVAVRHCGRAMVLSSVSVFKMRVEIGGVTLTRVVDECWRETDCSCRIDETRSTTWLMMK
jgi:hypothetical protein